MAFLPGEKAENALQHVYYTYSTDGGRTWAPDMRVTDRAIDRRLSDVWANGVHGPVGLFATNDVAYVAWDDSRNAIGESKAQDVYCTQILLDGARAVSGGGGASGTTKLQWTALGAAIGLVLCGLALGAAGAMGGSRPAAPAPTP